MSAEKPRATRDTALEDALRRIRILERIIPEKGCKFAVVSATGSIVNGGAAYTSPDLSAFDTNDTSKFLQDTTGSPGHSGGILITAAGRYMVFARADFADPAGGAVEPASSLMSCTWDSYNVTGSESDFHINQATTSGYPQFPLAPWGTGLSWAPWNLGTWDVGAAFIGPPYSEYHVGLYNGGTQTMNYTTALMVVWLGTASGL